MRRDVSTFPPLDAVDTVVREGQALVQRYRLMRALTDENGIRKDLRGADPEPELVAEMVRQLVPGVDAPLGTPGVNWPIPAGVRVEGLYGSPWLAEFVKPMDLFTLPTTAEEFAAGFQARTGIEPHSHAMDRNYRVTPIELGRIAMAVRGQAEKPSTAFLFLCMRHFGAAVEEDARAAALLSRPPVLAGRGRHLRFRRPLVGGFRLLGELDREALMIGDIGWLNLLSVRQIRRWLRNDNVKPLARALKKHPQLKRLFDYQMIGTDALGAFEKAYAREYVPIHPDLRGAAAARGRLDVDVERAVTHEGELARLILLAAFPDPPPGSRESALSNDGPVSFYGLNATLAGAMQADLGKIFQHGDDSGNASGADHERQASLAGEIVAHADPVLHANNVRRTAALAKNPKGKQPSGTNRQRDAQAHAKLMLPKRRIFGSAPRADAELWDNRWADAPLWQAFLDRRLGDLALGLDFQEKARVEAAFARLEELFERTFLAGCAPDDVEGRTDAMHALCDMATAVSAISANRHIGPAIQAWLALYEVKSVSRADIKDHGARWLPGIRHVLRVRKKKGVPSAGAGRKGTPRNERSATRKRSALNASAKGKAPGDGGAES